MLPEELQLLGEKSLFDDVLKTCPENLEIFDSLIVTNYKLKNYQKILCSISGGSDSDVMIDILTKLDIHRKITYVWFDTGLEYQATKDHLDFLERKYNVKIERRKAIKPIPTSCRQFGQPFLSKRVSDMIERLQRYGFEWEDCSFEELYEKYPKCKSALRWWCNAWGENSQFNINKNKYLKEFMVKNPPTFKISTVCCKYAKKNVAKKFIAEGGFDLNIYGVRKSEGGARATYYKNCFTDNSDRDKIDEFRPIFWYKNDTKRTYEKHYNVTHSKCYSQYGLKRTGCVGCPFGRKFEEELEIVEKYEPKLHRAVNKIFADSYTYTRKYREFVKMKDGK